MPAVQTKCHDDLLTAASYLHLQQSCKLFIPPCEYVYEHLEECVVLNRSFVSLIPPELVR